MLVLGHPIVYTVPPEHAKLYSAQHLAGLVTYQRPDGRFNLVVFPPNAEMVNVDSVAEGSFGNRDAARA